MAYLAFGLAALVLLALVGRSFLAANPATLARTIRWALIVVVGLALAFLLLTEEFGAALGLLGGILTVALRGRALWNQFRTASGPAPGKVSEVETAYLRMTLDHDSGTMSGVIRRGRHQGRALADLSRNDLVELWRECRAEDEPSARLLESYLDRVAPDWREAQSGEAEGEARRGSTSAAMTREEAYEILGLQPGATAGEVKAAHRRLMLKLHPDHGGSTYLAMRINQAKDLLLKG